MKSNIKDLVKVFLGIILYRRAIRTTRADLVYVNEHAVIQASIASWLCRIPSVIHVRSQLLKGTIGFRRYLIIRSILNFNEMVFAITDKEASQLNPREHEMSKIKIVGEFLNGEQDHPVRDTVRRSKQAMYNGKSMILMLGGVQKIKGTVDFLRAAQKVAAIFHDAIFVIAGTIRKNGNRVERLHYEECSRIIEDLKQSNQVLILGEIHNAMDWVARTDVLVAVSTESHFSRPVIEAWGFSKPVIASATAHMRSLIVNGVDGILVDVGDCIGLTGAIVKLLENKTLRVALGNAGKDKAKADFDASTNTSFIVDYCERILQPLATTQ